MQIGPLQIVVIGFKDDDNLRRKIKQELAAVRGRSVIRLLDVLFVHRDDQGQLAVIEDSDLSGAEGIEYGRAIKRLLGIDVAPVTNGGKARMGGKVAGIKASDVKAVADKLEPGSAAALVLFEHTWAAGLSAGVEEAGGKTLAQGMLTRDLVSSIGAELRAIILTELAIEATRAVDTAALIDAVAFASAAEVAEGEIVEQTRLPAADETTTRIAGRTLRALAAAGVVDDSELETAVVTLRDADLLSPDAVERGVKAALAREAEYAAVIAAQGAHA